jgi:hypothetical protein
VRLQARDLLLLAFIVFALMPGWGTGYIIAAAALPVLFGPTVRAHP